jgi:hypothetical protein
VEAAKPDQNAPDVPAAFRATFEIAGFDTTPKVPCLELVVTGAAVMAIGMMTLIVSADPTPAAVYVVSVPS